MFAGHQRLATFTFIVLVVLIVGAALGIGGYRMATANWPL